jgi:ABC transporter substrate binding protein
MRRREFIFVLAGLSAWPLGARAQSVTMPTVGVLHPGSPAIGPAAGIGPFLEGLNDAGYVDGRNVKLEVHWLDGRYEGLAALIADMSQRKVAAIFAVGIAIMRVAKAQAASIPIVFSMGEDPVKEGIVASFNRPRARAGCNRAVPSAGAPTGWYKMPAAAAPAATAQAQSMAGHYPRKPRKNLYRGPPERRSRPHGSGAMDASKAPASPGPHKRITLPTARPCPAFVPPANRADTESYSR